MNSRATIHSRTIGNSYEILRRHNRNRVPGVQIRVKLAYSYKIFMLETKAFENRLTQAVSMKNRYLKQYFGSNQAIIDFATYLLCSGHRSAAKELNRVVYVLGSKITPNDVIEQIEKEFKIGEIKNIRGRIRGREWLTHPAVIVPLGLILFVMVLLAWDWRGA